VDVKVNIGGESFTTKQKPAGVRVASFSPITMRFTSPHLKNI
jgi:hypothetical protein